MAFSLRKALILAKVSRFKSIRDVSRWAFRRYANSTALITEQGTLSFAQLGDRVFRLAQAMNSLGVQKGDSLFVLISGGQAQNEARLAAAEIGVVLTLLPIQIASSRVLSAAQLIKPKLIIHDPQLDLTTVRDLAAALPNLLFLVTGLDYEAQLAAHPPRESGVEVNQNDIAALGFTSGTTGQPKVLAATHGTYLKSLKLTLQNVDVGSKRATRNVFLIGIPLAGAGSGVVIPALFGGAAFLIPAKFEAGEFLDSIARHRITLMFITPSLLIDILDHPQLDQYDMSSLHTIIYGTELMPAAKLEEALRRFGPILQQGYGSAEVLPPVSMLQKSAHWHAGRPAARDVLTSVGLVVAGVHVIIGDETDAPLPTGAIGQVLIKSPTVFQGYWQRPDLNAEVLRGGYLHTSDMGYFDINGYLHVLGRRADLITRNNHITYPRRVEEIVHDFAAVKEASLVQVGTRAILAVSLRRSYRQAADYPVVAAALQEFLQKRIPIEDMPDDVSIFEELPRSPLAKVLRREVRAALEKPS